MKKRLRKKLRRGEFQELGFEVRFRAVDDIPDETFDDIVDALISQAIEANGLIWEARNREHLAKIAARPPKPRQEKIRARLQAAKAKLGMA
jgi:uncharacterized protein YggL (DUF469 family)